MKIILSYIVWFYHFQLLEIGCAGLEEDELVMLRLDGVNITTSELSVQR